MMDVKMLEAFVAVGEELHFGRAAERLHIAGPPLSHRIKQLEKYLGANLFERTTRSVALTPAGEALMGRARKILRDLEEAENLCRAAGTGRVGRLRCGFAGPSSRGKLPQLARAVREQYPEIELVLVSQTYSGAALELVAAGELDLALARLPLDQPNISYRVIGADEVVCALPADHPLASAQRISLAELRDDAFVMLPAGAGSTLREVSEASCRRAGFQPRVVQEAPDSHTVLTLVGAGVGATLTLTSVRHVQESGVVYLPIVDDLPVMDPVLAWRTDDHSAILARVLEVAESELPTEIGTLQPTNQHKTGP